MKKRICALTILLALVVSLFSAYLYAEEAVTTGATDDSTFKNTDLTPEGAGGLDFYSVTIHYEKPILVDYTYDKSTKSYLFEVDGVSAVSDEYIWRAGTTKNNGYYTNKSSKSAEFNFYQLQSSDLNIPALGHYSKVPYNYAYITYIQDGSIIKTKESVQFYGLTDPYDEGEPYVNKNPNVEYNSDGYALDKNANEDGSFNRIDINGYVITNAGENMDEYLWLDNEGQRIELFYQKCQYVCTGRDEKGKLKYSQDNIKFIESFVMIPFEKRFDENGKIKNVSSIRVLQYVSNEEMDAFLANVEAMLDADPTSVSPQNPQILEFHVATDEEEMAELIANKKSYKFPKNNYTYNQKYKISKVDLAATAAAQAAAEAEATAAPVEYEDSVYYSKNTSFTMDNILRVNDFLAYGTPMVGEPKLDVKIKDISVEIDAVGAQLYDNPEDDPQNQNTIVISLNDFELNCLAKKAALDEGYLTQEKYDEFSSMILGTVHSKTTSTEVNFDKNNLKTDAEGNPIDGTNYKSTVQSIYLNLDEETIAKIPETATIFLNFHIKTHQAEDAFDLSQCKTGTGKKSTLVAENANKYNRPAEKVPVPDENKTETSGLPLGALIGIIAGAAAVVIAVVVVIIVLAKKKKKA